MRMRKMMLFAAAAAVTVVPVAAGSVFAHDGEGYEGLEPTPEATLCVGTGTHEICVPP